MIHEPYFLTRRASRTPLVMAVLILGVIAFGLGEPQASAGATSAAAKPHPNITFKNSERMSTSVFGPQIGPV